MRNNLSFLILSLFFCAETMAQQFSPTTTIWTNRTIESILAQAGKYKTAKDVNPNASKTEKTNIQVPYGNDGRDFLTEWAYSEFVWTNFYPVGNGRMAAMVAGGIDNEVIQINEDTSWDGSPYGTLKDENGNTLTSMDEVYKAKRITTVNPTSGSVKGNSKYYKDIAAQALKIDNAHTKEAVQYRYDLESMVDTKFLGNPKRQRAYKSFVELYLDFGHNSANAKNYTKSLDLTTGIVTVEYDINGTHHKRETSASYPDQAIVTRISTDRKQDFHATLHSYHATDTKYFTYNKISDNEISLRAHITDGNKDGSIGCINAVCFEARLMLRGDGKFHVSADKKSIKVKGAKDTEIYVVGATNYVDYLNLDNEKPTRDCHRYIANIKSKTYGKIMQRHNADFTQMFNRSNLEIANVDATDYSSVPTELRVRKNAEGMSGFMFGGGSKLYANPKVNTTYTDGDNQLAVLEFNYGKYLIISGSRPGRKATQPDDIDIAESQPLNLTGKWNAAMSAGWNGKYTININTEMNYWAAQPLNIGECERPLTDTFHELAKSGSITADYQYGIGNSATYKPGAPWVMHHNFDLWRGTQPIDNATAGLWYTGGAWLLDHAWQYYLYNNDKEYLRELYPYMAGAARFFTDFLIVDPQTGYLITAASCSPEQGGVQPGPAMDTQLIRNLYDMVRKAAKILGKENEDAQLLAKIEEQMPTTYFAEEKGRLAPNLIDGQGLIQEWVRGDVGFDFSKKNNPEEGKYKFIHNKYTGKDISINEHFASNNSMHRHCSHLWEIYPGTHLSAFSTNPAEQALFKAFRKSVDARGAGTGHGWGVAWRISLNARALNGEQSSKMLEQLFQTRTSPNLFDQHPNFQIDGNYGATAGILEMLIQSHDGAVTLLPAIPQRWANGSFKGFVTREGAVIDLVWLNGNPTELTIHATKTQPLRIRVIGMEEQTIDMEKGKTYTLKL